MTDFETAYQITEMMSLFLDGFALLTTLIFAYVTGAFYFLHRAPIFTKIVSFSFLVFAIFFVMINMFGAFLHYMAVVEQVEEQMANPDVATLITAIYTGQTEPMAHVGFWTILAVVLGTLVMCFWMTFKWSPNESSKQKSLTTSDNIASDNPVD